MNWNWAPLASTFIVVLLGIIGYLFSQNVIWMRREISQLATALSRLQDSHSSSAIQAGAQKARLEDLGCRVAALERRREPEHGPVPGSAE